MCTHTFTCLCVGTHVYLYSANQPTNLVSAMKGFYGWRFVIKAIPLRKSNCDSPCLQVSKCRIDLSADEFALCLIFFLYSNQRFKCC